MRRLKIVGSKAALVLSMSACLSVAWAVHGQSSMGTPADGVHYTIEGSHQVAKPDSADCGFNDIGAANAGYFRRENRAFIEYKDGAVLRRWHEDVDVFLGCHEP